MITSSIAESAPANTTDPFEAKEWEELKETFAQASELYDRDDLPGSIALLRGVIHECHRFLLRHPDPTLFFSPPDQRENVPDSPVLAPLTPSVVEDRLWRDWHWTHERGRGNREDRMSTSPPPDRDPSGESPSAFYAVFGTALFLFGNLIAQNASLVLSREPAVPSLYWLAALDVFNACDNLPSRTSGVAIGAGPTTADDWRIAVAWGRILVCLADEATAPSRTPVPAAPRFAPRSPLAAIVALRMPGVSHARASASALLTLAADQFSRGIFHMPHTQPTPAPGPPDARAFSRPRELFTLASEVLGVAERLRDADARRKWALWADAIFHQMHMEADVDEWRARVTVARGRCWLAAGSARADELEDALEQGDAGVLRSREAEDARQGLAMAISFFERAKGSASTDSPETSLQDMQPLLAEALLSLANLTADEDAREALYTRAQAEGGEAVTRELGPRPTAAPTEDVRMDES
ncbi:hypothetical protein BC834DRAFT_835112 [Gloeopeniophorella convolvens]|nr:hypothetical protein BC834DRAFT_835112 [Gloeopeniophorella convolvens]